MTMVDIGLLSPCVVTYNSLLNSYCKNGRLDDGLALFREMLGKNVKLCAITYNIILQGLFRAGRTAAASTEDVSGSTF
jgi:pentatricopeptide repeat protein